MKLILLNIVCLILIISSCSHSKNPEDQESIRISIEVDESAEIKLSHFF